MKTITIIAITLICASCVTSTTEAVPTTDTTKVIVDTVAVSKFHIEKDIVVVAVDTTKKK